MTNEHWIPIFISQSQAVMTYWNVFIVVVAAIIGFIIQRGALLSEKEKYLFIVGFVVFAISNGVPLFQAQETLVGVHGKISGTDKQMFIARNENLVIAVHVLFDLLLVFLIYKWPFTKPNNANSADARASRD